MIKKLLFTILLIASVASYSCYVSERANRTVKRPKTLLENAKTADGSYMLSSLLASTLLTDERKAAFQEADLDKNGLISVEEYKSLPELASKWAEEAKVKHERQMIEDEMNARLFALLFEIQSRRVAIDSLENRASL